MSEMSDQGFRSLVENAEVPIATSDLKGRFSYVNRALADLLGYSVQDLMGRSFTDFLHPHDRGRVTRLFLKIILLRRRPRGLEFRVLRKDGHILHLMSKPTRFVVNGKTVGFQAIIVDITERKKAEDALRRSENRSRTLLENLPQKIFFKDKNSVYVSCNKNYARDLKIHPDEVSGRTDYDFYPKELAEKYRADDKRIMESGNVEDIEEEYVKDGQKMFVYTVKTPVKDEKGNVVGILGIFWDITERKQMEEKLIESENRLRQLIEYAPDAIYVHTVEGIFTEGNKQAEKLTGYNREELIGKNILNTGLISKRRVPMILELMQKTANGEKVGPVEIEMIRKDRTTAIVEVSAFPVKRGGKVEVCGIARDTTERKKMLEKLEEYPQQLEKLIEKRTAQLRETQQKLVKQERLAAIGQVSSMVGHDLRNPLTGIAGATYYLKKRLSSSLDERSKEMFTIIENNIKHSNEIVDDLLEYSKDVKLELEKATLKSAVQDALSTVEVPSSINVINTIDEKQDIMLDIQKMKRVFINIIKNAVDAMPNSGTLKIASAQTNDRLQIAFSDTGSGMPKEILEKVWTPFFTTKAKGMGLGLPICKRMVEAHGGTIAMESIVGKGTTVTIALPISPRIMQDGGEEAWVNKPEFLSSMMTKA